VVRTASVTADKTLLEAIGNQAGELIVQQAKDWEAHITVCGTHGRLGLRQIVLGSDAEYIMRHTPVPILLVRRQEPIVECRFAMVSLSLPKR